MRILWLNHRDIRDPRAGGAERTIEEVASRLVGRGHEVQLVTTRWADSLPEERIRGIHIYRDSTPLGPHLRALTFYRNSSFRPDVVVNDLAHAIPWLTPLLSDLPGTVFFRHLHRRSLSGQVSRPLALGLQWIESRYPLLYRKWPFVTESKSSMADLLSMGIPPGQVARIPPGVNTDLFVPGVKASDPTVIYFGGMRDYKRPLDVLYACRILKDKGWDIKLYMIGSGPLLGEVGRLIQKLGLEGTVTLKGRISDAELVSVVQRSHVNLHCSRTEGWCLSAMEAAACGVPTVAYRVPGIVDSVSHGESGWLVADAGPEALYRGVEYVLQSPNEWERKCRNYAERFSWKECVSNWEEHLHSVASRTLAF